MELKDLQVQLAHLVYQAIMEPRGLPVQLAHQA